MVIIIELSCQNVKCDYENGIFELLTMNYSRLCDILTGSEGGLIMAVTYKKLFHLMIDKGITIVKNSMLNDKLSKLTPEDRDRIYDVIDTLIKHSKQIIS